MKDVADQAAHGAVTELMEKLGVDINNHLEMQEDFAWMRHWRQMSTKIGSRVLMTLFTIVTVGISGLIWSQMGGK